MSVRLGRFMESSGVLPTTQFAYWKGLGAFYALLYVSHTLQTALESEPPAYSPMQYAVNGTNCRSVQI